MIVDKMTPMKPDTTEMPKAFAELELPVAEDPAAEWVAEAPELPLLLEPAEEPEEPEPELEVAVALAEPLVAVVPAALFPARPARSVYREAEV